MHCTSCGAEQPAGTSFCAGCGAAVVRPSRLARLVTPVSVTIAAGAVLLAGLVTATVRDLSRGDDLRRTKATLASTRGDLDGTKSQLESTEKKLADESARLAKATTELSGVRGSLAATSSERDAMRKCFDGFLEAIGSGSPAQAEAIMRRVESECEKVDHLF